MDCDKPAVLIIDGNTSITGELRIQPVGKDEFTIRLGWLRLDDLIDMLTRLQTTK